MLENKNQSLQKQCKELIASFVYNEIEHRTDTGMRQIDKMSEYHHDSAILQVDRWHKTAGEQWGNCAGIYFRVKSIGHKYVKLSATNYRTDNQDWWEYRTIDIEQFLSFLIDWKIAEDCDEPADQDILLKKLSAKIANFFN